MNKLKRLMALDPDEMNILVAEKLGWESNGNGAWHRGDEVVTLHGSCSDGCGGIGSGFDAMTNYQGDLNACHEFERFLSKQKNSDGGSRMPWYRYILNEVCCETGDILTGAHVHADARQRCAAFLLVMENR